MNTARAVLAQIALIILWSYPWIARRKGNPAWQRGFGWKYALFLIGAWVFQAVLYFCYGALIGLLFGRIGLDMLYIALAIFATSQIVIELLMIRKLT